LSFQNTILLTEKNSNINAKVNIIIY